MGKMSKRKMYVALRYSAGTKHSNMLLWLLYYFVNPNVVIVKKADSFLDCPSRNYFNDVCNTETREDTSTGVYVLYAIQLELM